MIVVCDRNERLTVVQAYCCIQGDLINMINI